MTRLHLIRHGQASLGSQDYDRLSPLGIRQSEILGEYLAALELKFEAIYSGEMERQTDTAALVMEKICGRGDRQQLVIRPDFNEYDAHTIVRLQIPTMIREDPQIANALERLVTDGKALKMVFVRAMTAWVSGKWNAPEVETWPQYVDRVRTGIATVVQENSPGSDVAVFTSGGAICVAMLLALGLSAEQCILLALQTINTGVSVFHYSDGELSLSCFNSRAHLDLRKDPTLITYR